MPPIARAACHRLAERLEALARLSPTAGFWRQRAMEFEKDIAPQTLDS
jgi:hypothetical protein